MFFRDALRRYVASVREKRIGLAACAAAYWFGSAFFLFKGLELYRNLGMSVCAADCYVMASMAGRRIMVGLPVFLALHLLQTQNRQSVQYVLRVGTRVGVWRGQCLETLFRALCMTALETVAIGLNSAFMTPALVNREERGSVFWNATEHTIRGIAFGQVVLYFLTVTLCVYFGTGMLLSLADWVRGNCLAGACACLVLAFAETFSELSVFYGRVTLFYSQWLTGEVWRNWLWVIFLILLLIPAGIWYADRKEFYGQ